jgi:hypothetical protein
MLGTLKTLRIAALGRMRISEDGVLRKTFGYKKW